MVNLLVDISNMFYRAMFAASKYGKNSSYTYDSEFECEQLMRKVCVDLALVIRQTRPDRVMICKDSKPWRKDITIEENEGYKGNRKANTLINWENVYKIQADFFKIISNKGVIVCDIHGAEADDIIAMWVEEMFNKRNESCIILSGDEDIRQLINSKETNNSFAFVSVLNPIKQGGKNPTKKIYHDGKLVDWVNSPSKFSSFEMMFSNNKDTYKENLKPLINDDQFEKIVVNGNKVALNKFFMGDAGDNIPSFYTWKKTTKAGKETTDRITPKKYEKIVETLGLTQIGDLNVSNIRELKTIIEEFALGEMDVNIMARVDRQRKLVELKSCNFPESIVDTFSNNVNNWLALIPSLIYPTLSMRDILLGSRFISDNFSAYNIEPSTQASIFDDIEKIKNIKNRNSYLF